ncbi:hypothetical protein PVAG01_04634 [Phlyctema vagabunda]|uniref:Uncharacterized protein n=1 Tax=Phlyctema vagabunda TaxID=108571 RepID=A0ABR4PIG3_9HELO
MQRPRPVHHRINEQEGQAQKRARQRRKPNRKHAELSAKDNDDARRQGADVVPNDISSTPLMHSPSSRAMAPYVPASQAADRKLQFLIHHYCTVVVQESVTSVGPRYEWFPFALRNKAFFHSVMSSTSSHAAYLQQVDLPKDFFYHRGEAIRMLNAQIAAGRHDEGTINTVAVFSQQESFEGRADSTKIHLNGLLQLVRAAGGLQSPTLSPKTRRYVAHTDQAASIVLMTKEIFPTTLVADLETYFKPPSPMTAELTKDFRMRLSNFTSNGDMDDLEAKTTTRICEQAADVYWGLRNLTLYLQDVRAGKEEVETASPEDIQFSDRVEVLERLVYPLWSQDDHIILRVFGWTCLIYIYVYLRELPYQLGMNPMLAARIKSGLEKSGDLNVLLATFQDLFLWQMFLCGKVANSRDKQFFARQVTRILMIRRLEREEDILPASESFLWPEKSQVFSPDDGDRTVSEYGSSQPDSSTTMQNEPTTATFPRGYSTPATGRIIVEIE